MAQQLSELDALLELLADVVVEEIQNERRALLNDAMSNAASLPLITADKVSPSAAT